MISIDTVYQRVLAIANKEQRGYITPQEFNLLANQAQMDMFEQYFYEMNFQEKGEEVPEAGSLGDMVDLIEDKLRLFTSMEKMTYVTSNNESGWQPPADFYRYGNIYFKNITPKIVDLKEIAAVRNSTFHNTRLSSDPLMARFGRGWRVFDASGEVNTGSDMLIEAIRKPVDVRWGYIVVNEQALYNASASIDFELHEADETDLVIKILELAGMVINKPQLAAFAGQEEGGNAAEENK